MGPWMNEWMNEKMEESGKGGVASHSAINERIGINQFRQNFYIKLGLTLGVVP
jgi:hypothetical protein